MSKATTPPAGERKGPEITTREGAAVVDGLITGLYDKWQKAVAEAAELKAGWDSAAADASVREAQYKHQLKMQEQRIDDLSQREFTLQEKLDLERIEGEAMRGEIRHLRAVINSAAERAENAVMREIGDRQERRNATRSGIDVAGIESALLQAADIQNKKGGAVPVADIVADEEAPARPTRLPEPE